jgi:hypothetical protein
MNDHIKIWFTTRKMSSFWNYFCQCSKLVTVGKRRGILPFLFQRKKVNILKKSYEAEAKALLFSLSRHFHRFYHVEVSLCHEKKNQLPSLASERRTQSLFHVHNKCYSTQVRKEKFLWHSFLLLLYRVWRTVFGESNRHSEIKRCLLNR